MMNRIAWQLVAATLALGATAVNASWFSTPGQECQPYYPSRNFLVERDYSRIINPVDSPEIVWVTCPVESSDLHMTAAVDNLYVHVYYAEGVTGNVTCKVRRFNWDTRYVLGEPGTDVDEIDIAIATPPAWPSADGRGHVDPVYFASLNHDGAYKYTTVACRLRPGTGINSIDYNQN